MHYAKDLKPCFSLQLFRADLISAMKLPDSMPLESGSFLTIKEPWRTEWEIGVQVSPYFALLNLIKRKLLHNCMIVQVFLLQRFPIMGF